MLLFLVGVSIHLQASARRVYVEVVLRGETEGKFLEDPGAHRDEIMEQVSKLSGFYCFVAKPNETLTILPIEFRSLLDPCRHRP